VYLLYQSVHGAAHEDRKDNLAVLTALVDHAR